MNRTDLKKPQHRGVEQHTGLTYNGMVSGLRFWSTTVVQWGPMGLESVVEEGDDLRSLYVTARTSLYRVQTRVSGLPAIGAQ